MDTKRLDTPENKQVFYQSLKFKLTQLAPYDAVIVGDDNALQFAIDHQSELFPKIPIVFLGVNDEIRARQAAANPFITGIIERISIKETLAIARVFNPEATRVVGIADQTLTGQGNHQQFEALRQDFPVLSFTTLNTPDYSFAELGAELEQLGDDTILLFLDMNPDKQGAYMDFEKAAAFLYQHTQIPVYRASVGGVGTGLMGGKMVDYQALGKTAAELVVKIFSGTPVETIAMIEETPYYYIFDYALLQHYKVPDQLTPADAVLINKTEQPLDKYRNLILATAIVLIALTLVTLLLIYDNLRRRSMQKALEFSNAELKITYNELEAVEGALRRQYEVMEEHDREVGELNQKFELAIEGTNSAVREVDLTSKTIHCAGDCSRIINKTICNHSNVHCWLDLVLEASHRDQLLAEVHNYLAGKIAQINIQVLTAIPEPHQKWLLIRDKCQPDAIESDANEILSAFDTAFILDNREIFVSVSMGISCYPRDSHAIDQLIMNADTAMYEVKNRGKNHFMYYHHELKKEMNRKIEIETMLRTALKGDGFKLVYHAQVDLRSGRTSGFEALLRFKEHSLGPDQFIPVAEETGLISEIGRWVAREVVAQIVRWRKEGLAEKPVAINFSNRQLRDKDYVSHITTLLQQHHVEPRFIEIEITESILMENNFQTDQFLKALKAAGLSVALDDFGTGYSSLNCLTYLPVNKIKLDKSICDQFLQGNRIKVIESLILLAHSLNLKIMAEGIEAWDKVAILKNSGCDGIQGYVFSKPLEPTEIAAIYNHNLLTKAPQ